MIVFFEAGEEIITKVRKHWFVFAVQALPLAVLCIIPLIFFAIGGSRFASSSVVQEAGPSFPLFFAGLWYLVVWVLFFIKWTDYYLDVFILTDRRVIYITQKGLFSRRIATSRLDRVQDVSAEVTGMMPTFLNYGDVHVQTAGEEKEFIFHDLPNPDIVKDRILSQYNSAIRMPRETAPVHKNTEV
ncbi:MAG: PH domain-containing protein [Patescibacteria group bacterium]